MTKPVKDLTSDEAKGLSDEELKTIIEGAAASAPPPPKDDTGGGEPVAPEEKKADDKPGTAAAAPAPVEKKEPEKKEEPEAKGKVEEKKGEEKLIAGKYKTPEELLTALNEIAKPLGSRPIIPKAIVEAARESGDYSLLEAAYRELEQELGREAEARRREEAAKPKTAGEKDEIPAESPAEVALREDAVYRYAWEDVKKSPLMAEFDRLGLELPTGPEGYREIYNRDRWLADQFLIQFNEAKERYSTLAKEQRVAQFRQRSNPAIIEAEVKKIMEEAVTKYALPTTEADVRLFVDSVYEKDPLAVTDLAGVKLNNSGRGYDAFLLRNVGRIIEAATLQAEKKGRKEYAEDLDKGRADAGRSLTESRVPPRSPSTTQPKGKKYTDEDLPVIRRMGDEELEAAIAAQRK